MATSLRRIKVDNLGVVVASEQTTQQERILNV